MQTHLRFWQSILFPLLLGILIRELLAPFTGHPFDFELWLRLGFYVSKGVDPYTATNPIPALSMPGAGRMTWLGYPPLWAFFQAGLYFVYSFIGVNDRFVYYFIVKQPMIISDVLCAFMLGRIIGKLRDNKTEFAVVRFWLFCPFTIIISAVWGMFDQIILLIVLASVLLLSKTEKSALLESFGFLLKVIPLIFLPILAFAQREKWKIAEYLVIAIGVSILFALAPYFFFNYWNLNSMIGVGVDVAGKITSSMNYWILLHSYSQIVSLGSYQFIILEIAAYIWIPALLLGSYYCIHQLRRNLERNITRNIVISLLFITLIFFLTKSVVNEQYTIYFMGFGLVDFYTLASKRRRRLFHAVWLSAFAFLVINNSYLVRFLEPISTNFLYLDLLAIEGTFGVVRADLMDILGVFFSLFSLLYLASLYLDIKKGAMFKDTPKTQVSSDPEMADSANHSRAARANHSES